MHAFLEVRFHRSKSRVFEEKGPTGSARESAKGMKKSAKRVKN